MFGILVQSRFDYKKPQCILHLLTQVSYACFRPLLPFGSACSSFLLNVSTTRIHGWIGRGTGVSPREDNHAVLVASLRFRHGYRLAVHTLAALPPGLPGQASELYYENVR